MSGDLTKYLVLISICTMACISSMAQPRVTFSALENANLSVDSLKLDLSITPEQAHVLTLLNDRYSVRFDSIRLSNDNRFEKFAKTVHLKSARDTELKFLLSTQQFRTYRSHEARQNMRSDDRQWESVSFPDSVKQKERPSPE